MKGSESTRKRVDVSFALGFTAPHDLNYTTLS
jgi:hypothetical protein